MAEKLAILRKNGGGMSETVLWTNPNPASAYPTASSQRENLSDSISNYKYVKFVFNKSTYYSTDTADVIYDAQEFVTKFNVTGQTSGIYFSGMVSMVDMSNGTYYIRRFIISESNDGSNILFVQGYQITSSNAVSVNKAVLIPQEIIGIK